MDTNLRIVEVGGDWDRFAASNDGGELDGGKVLGTRLFDWISGDRTRMWVEAVFQKLWLTDSIYRPYRCDSETVAREMEMVATRDQDGYITVVNSVVGMHHKDISVAISHRRFPGSRPAIRCSVCNSVRTNGEWYDPFERGQDQAYTVTQTVCGACERSLTG